MKKAKKNYDSEWGQYHCSNCNKPVKFIEYNCNNCGIEFEKWEYKDDFFHEMFSDIKEIEVAPSFEKNGLFI